MSVPGATAEDRLKFLDQLDDYAEYRQRYFELAIMDTAWQVRELGAYMWGEQSRAVPILLQLITSDPHPKVRLSAALNLHCKFDCNGNDYDNSLISAFEKDLALLDAAIRDETAGRYIVEILDITWCRLSFTTRVSVHKVLASDLPYGNSTVSINKLAKQLLAHHPLECLEDSRPNKSLERSRER
jgi:hypothetical protein